MKATEIIWKEESILPHSANAYPKGKPYMVQMVQGYVFPISKAQAISFVKMGCCLGALNSEYVRVVELLLKRHQLEGCYRYTKGKDFVQLINQCDLDKALQAEYGF